MTADVEVAGNSTTTMPAYFCSARVIANVGEVVIARQQAKSMGLRVGSDVGVGRAAQPDVPHIDRLMALLPDRRGRAARQRRVEEKVHRASTRGQGIVLLLVHALGGESECGLDIVRGQIVLALNFVARHPAGQAADDEGHGRPRTADYGLAVANGGVDDNSVVRDLEFHTDVYCPSSRRSRQASKSCSARRQSSRTALAHSAVILPEWRTSRRGETRCPPRSPSLICPHWAEFGRGESLRTQCCCHSASLTHRGTPLDNSQRRSFKDRLGLTSSVLVRKLPSLGP